MTSLSELDKQYVWHPFTQMADWATTEPLIIERADGNYLIDHQGQRYLDGISSLWVSVHGHRCAAIDEALKQQIDRVAHSTLLGLSNPPAILLAQRLISIAPSGLGKVFYSDSGSTAVEVALKIAFQYWQLNGQSQKTKFVTLENAYHGDTLGAVSVGGIDLFHQIFHPLLFQALRVPAPHPYRDPYQASGAERGNAERCKESSLAVLRQLFAQHASSIAALIIEPRIQGAAGMIVHPVGFLAEVARLCQAHDVLLIADEVATGFGRTGTLFSCQAENVAPDLMCVAKGLTGGYLPLAATLVSDRVFSAFLGDSRRTFFHGHTYTGNPLACAAALASLDLFHSNDVLGSVNRRAEFLTTLLREHLAPLPHVGDIRQLGLMVGIELVADRDSAQPFSVERRIGHRVCMQIRRHGVILRPLGDVIVLMPPLSITDAELRQLVLALRDATAEVLH